MKTLATLLKLAAQVSIVACILQSQILMASETESTTPETLETMTAPGNKSEKKEESLSETLKRVVAPQPKKDGKSA
jgi:hypothetical protein